MWGQKAKKSTRFCKRQMVDDDEGREEGYFRYLKRCLRNLPDNLILFYIFGEYVKFVPILSCNVIMLIFFYFHFRILFSYCREKSFSHANYIWETTSTTFLFPMII